MSGEPVTEKKAVASKVQLSELYETPKNTEHED